VSNTLNLQQFNDLTLLFHEFNIGFGYELWKPKLFLLRTEEGFIGLKTITIIKQHTFQKLTIEEKENNKIWL